MKIVFAGTPEYASFHLELLLNSEHKIPFILTQPDKKSGRGNKIKVSPVKNLALKRGVEVKQPHTLKGNKKIISVLKEKNLDLILVVAYGLLIPREVLEIPKMGCINIHASLLPRWRGAAPIEHCILGGDIKSGITFMKMDQGLDTGPILRTVSCPVSTRENARSLEDKLKKLSSLELIKFLKDFSLGKIKEKKQNVSKATYAQKITPKDTQIIWSDFTAEFIDKKVRSLFPKYGAYTFLGKSRVKILNSKVNEEYNNLEPGILLIDKRGAICVGCKDNTSLNIELLQIEGKKTMSSEEFIKGNKEKILQSKKFSSSVLEN